MTPTTLGAVVNRLGGSCGPALHAISMADPEPAWDAYTDGIGMIWFCYAIGVEDGLVLEGVRECLGDPTVTDIAAGLRELFARHDLRGPVERASCMGPRFPDLFAGEVRAIIPWSRVAERLAPDATGALVPHTPRRGLL